MNANPTRMIAGIVAAIVLSAPLAAALATSLVFTNLTGNLQIAQQVPCGGVVAATTSVAGGTMTITPSQVNDGVKFNLARLDVFYTPFTVGHECNGFSAAVEFREIGVRLAGAVSFIGEPIGTPEEQLYRFLIPKEQFLIFESIVDDQPVAQPQTRYKKPSADVTGVIDLRQGTAQLNIALGSTLHFRAGCVRDRCVIDEALDGTQTTSISASLR